MSRADLWADIEGPNTMRIMKRFFLVVLGCAICPVAIGAENSDDIKATVRWLLKHQAGNGGFVAKADKAAGAPSLRVTSAAVRAVHYLGGEVPNKRACQKFVASCYDQASGGFADMPGGKPDVFVTAVGIMAVAALKMPRQDYQAGVVKYLSENAKTFEDIRIAVAGLEAIGKPSVQAKKWLDQVEKMRNDDGTFGAAQGQARSTGGAVVAILRLGGKVESRAAALKALKDGQRLNGGFGKDDADVSSDLETTYRVMRAFFMLKEKPADPDGVLSFVLKCRNQDGGYGVAPGQPSTVPATYYAAIIRHWLKKN